jgi:type 1 glutamine amidotransferase
MDQTASPNSVLYVTDVSPYPPVDSSSAPRPAGTHQALDASLPALRDLAKSARLPFNHFDDVRQIPLSDIEQARVLVLYTIGDTPWSQNQQDLILQRVRSGAMGIVGLHSATDSAQSWPEFERLVGARFVNHPITAALHMDVCDQFHSATSHLGPQWAFRDELYIFRSLRSDANILLQVNGQRVEDLDERERDNVFPLSWCFQEGEGRCFYTSLGHFAESFEDPHYIKHLYGGLTWVVGG